MEQKVFKIKIDGIDEFKTLDQIINMTSKSLTDMKEKQKTLNEALKDSRLSVTDIKFVNEAINDLNKSIKATDTQANSLNTTIKKTGDVMKTAGDSTQELKSTSLGLVSSFASTSKEGDVLAKSLGNLTTLYGALGLASKTVSNTLETGFSKSATSAQKFSNAFKIALASTGVGLLVVAFAGLVAYFQSTQEGADKLTKIFAGLNGVIRYLTTLIVPVGKFIVDAFSKPEVALKKLTDLIKDNLTNRLEAVRDIFKAISNFSFKGVFDSILKFTTGIDNINGKVKDLVNNAQSAYAASADIAQKWIDIDTKEIENNKLTRENLRDREAQRVIQDDELKTINEKKEANKKIIALADIEIARQKTLLQSKIDLAKKEAEINSSAAKNTEIMTALNNKLTDAKKRYNDESAVIGVLQAQASKISKDEAVKTYTVLKEIHDKKLILENTIGAEVKSIQKEIADASKVSSGQRRDDSRKVAQFEEELAAKQEEDFALRAEQTAFLSALEKASVEANADATNKALAIRTELTTDYYDKLKKLADNEKKSAEDELRFFVGNEEKKNDLLKAIAEKHANDITKIEVEKQKERDVLNKQKRNSKTEDIEFELARNIKLNLDKLEDDKAAAENDIKEATVLADTKKYLEEQSAKDIKELKDKANADRVKSIEELRDEEFLIEKNAIIELGNYNISKINENANLSTAVKLNAIQTESEKIKTAKKEIANRSFKSDEDNAKKEQDALLKSVEEAVKLEIITIEEGNARKATIIEEFNLKLKNLKTKNTEELLAIDREFVTKSNDIQSNGIKKWLDKYEGDITKLMGDISTASNSVVNAYAAIINLEIDKLDTEIERIQGKKSELEEELSAFEERLADSNEKIKSLEESLKTSTGGVSTILQNQLEAERKKQVEINKARKDAIREINNLKAAEKAATAEKIKQGKLIEEAQRKQAVVANILTVAQTGLAIASLAAQSAKQDFTFGAATIASIAALSIALVANIVATAASLQGFADGGLVTLSGQKINSNDGISKNFSNGDNMIASVKTGEVILNERQQEMLGGAATFSRLGLKGFAEGGLVSNNTINEFTTTTIEPNSNIVSLLQAQTQAIATLAERPIYTSITDLNSATETFNTQQNRAVAF